MWLPEEGIVISDLHLAAERDHGLFKADGQLAEFLSWVYENSRYCHLFLNGDIFDFLVTKQEAVTIDLDEAAAHAAAIIDNHKEIFDSLRLLANSEDHEVIIIGGNHDPELALPTVQKEVERHLSSACSHPPVRWLSNGEGALLQIGEAKVLIEHGDQYDAWNWIDHEALRRVICLASRNVSYDGVYTAPPGSLLVLNRFNRLREQFPWLQTLQPLSASLLPVALEVIIPGLPRNDRIELIKAAKEFCDFGRRSVTDIALRSLDRQSEYWANDDEERQSLRDWLAGYQREEVVWSKIADTKAWLTGAVARLRKSAAQRVLKRVSHSDTFFDISANDSNHEAVSGLLSQGTNLVVHGHTHAAKAYQVDAGLYFNSGTWGELTKLPDSDASDEVWTSYLEELRAGRAPAFQRPTFVRIIKQKENIMAGLFEWQSRGPQQHAAWCFADHQWRKESNNQ